MLPYSPYTTAEQRRQRDLTHLDLIRSFVNRPKCGTCDIDPAIFTIAQIHIDMVTMLYPSMWFDMTYIPSVKQIRAYIWQLSGYDAGLIEYAKRWYRDDRSELGIRLEWLGVLREVKRLVS